MQVLPPMAAVSNPIPRSQDHSARRPAVALLWGCLCVLSAAGCDDQELPSRDAWLLYVGRRPPPELNWSVPAVNAVATLTGRNRKLRPGQSKLSKREANATPPKFADLLIELAQHSRRPRSKRRAAA
jgi:hypothetical protein